MIGKLKIVLLIILLGGSLAMRTFRTPDLLRFYYDQGRDAMVVSDMILKHQPVLVGPTTGLAGILRGPAFYYLLLPAYIVGQGSPIIAAIWLQIINLFGLYIFYRLAKELFSPLAGLLAVGLLGLSAHMVDLSRWLSNPSPVLTTVPLMLYGMVSVLRGRTPQFWLPVVALMLGLNLQFEMASEIWFIPVVVILLVLRGRTLQVTRRTALISIAIFLLTLVPQVIFDIRHEGIMRNAIIQNFTHPQSPSFGFNPTTIRSRLTLFTETYTYILSPYYSWTLPLLFFLFVPILFFAKVRRGFVLPLIFFLTPLTILTFFIGNSGNFYTYYLIGTFPIFILLVSGILSVYLSRLTPAFFFAIILIFFALIGNFRVLNDFFRQGIDGPNSITIRNQLDNIDWIYQTASGRPFRVEVYVPPVIPYSYDYLFRWYGQNKYGYVPDKNTPDLEFILYENDDRVDRFTDWYSSKTAGYPTAIDKYSSGGVHSEVRVTPIP